MFRKTIISFALLLASLSLQAQFKFYEDTFNGGVVTGGFSPGVGVSSSGSFTVNIPAGSTIRRAYLIGGRCGAAPATTVQLNGTNYIFNAANAVTSGFNTLYGGPGGVHAIDVTANISPATTFYTINDPGQSSVSNKFPEYYLWIAFDNPSMSATTAVIFFNNQATAASMPWPLTFTTPILNGSPVALAVMGGYAAPSASDCERLTVNGTFVGTYSGQDFNANSQWGAMAGFAYYGNAMIAYGDDNINQAVNGPDALSNIQALIPANTTAFTVQYDHCPGGNGQDNHVWATFITHSGVILPAEVGHFDGTLNPDHTVTLNWETQEEQAVAHYVIERSLNGTDYHYLGETEARNAAGPNLYTQRDENRVFSETWYRLKVVDLDGVWKDGGTVLVSAHSSDLVVDHFPNPVQRGNDFHIELGMDVPVEASVSSIAGGAVLMRLQADHFSGNGTRLRVPTDQLAAGVYLLKVQGGGRNAVVRMVVQ